jgi:hypothetical protein
MGLFINREELALENLQEPSMPITEHESRDEE